MLSFIVIFVFISISSIYTLPQSRQSTDITELGSLISSEHCNFYITLNTQYQCGPKSHLMQYSYKYCQRLVDTRSLFENIQYQDNARQCLQQKLFAKIQEIGQETITCDNFKQIDLDSHGSCLAVSFKDLSANDIIQFIGTFKDTTVNYGQLCKLANNFAGHWSQIVQADLMSFVKKELNVIFPEGDTSTCTIKESEIIEEIVEIISEVEKVIDQVKDIKNDITLIIEKAKSIRDDFKIIQETIKGMENGSISGLDGLKIITEKTQTVLANSKTIIDTIKNLVKNKSDTPTPEGQSENGNISQIFDDMIKIIDQVEALKGEVYKIVDNVNSIIDVVDNIRDGKTDLFDGLISIVGQLDQGVDDIYSIINTSYTLKETVIDLVDTIVKDVEGAVDEIVDKVEETVDEVVGGATDAVEGAIGGIGGGLGGFGK